LPPKARSLLSRGLIFAADTVAVAVEMPGITRLSGADRSGSCSPCGSAIGEIHIAAYCPLGTGRCIAGTSPVAVTAAIFAVIVAAIGGKAAAMCLPCAGEQDGK
jgi:hypothetical protein